MNAMECTRGSNLGFLKSKLDPAVFLFGKRITAIVKKNTKDPAKNVPFKLSW